MTTDSWFWIIGLLNGASFDFSIGCKVRGNLNKMCKKIFFFLLNNINHSKSII